MNKKDEKSFLKLLTFNRNGCIVIQVAGSYRDKRNKMNLEN